jgi:uncharacterized protein
MQMSMYQASVPVFTRALTSLKNVLQKAKDHAAAKKIDESVILGLRLYPDMFALNRQVHVATDFARGTVARLAGSEPPSWEDNETTLDQLIARCDRAIEAVKSFTPAQIDGSEDRPVTRKVRGQDKTFTGINFLQQYALPNVWFHCVTAYAILRANGVELGKGDFIGTLD